MNISEAILHLFPNAEPIKDFLVMDNGAGQFIAQWNLSKAKPSNQELQAAWEEYNAHPPQEPPSEIELLKQRQEIIQQALDDLILGGGF